MECQAFGMGKSFSARCGRNLYCEGKLNTTELPVLIGVTGHRNLLDPEAVTSLLELFFTQLAASMPDTRFCLVSGLAAGADQLFIECGKRVLASRAETFAVLPFPREVYQKDFSERELPAFRRLLDSSDYVKELPGSRTNEAEAYFEEGNFLIKNVNILVSVWDGKVACDLAGNPQKGGTWDISDLWMNYAQHNPKELFSTFHIPSLIRIPAERIGNANRIDIPYQAKDSGLGEDRLLIDFDSSVEAEDFFQYYFLPRNADYALEQINAYNALCRRISAGREKSKEYLGVTNTSGVKKEIERYAVLDDSANKTQKRYSIQFSWIFMLSFFLGAFAQIYGGINHDFLSFHLFSCHFRPITWSLPAYFILVIAVFAYYFYQRKVGIDNKYQDYRVLAELLRISIFWKIAGLRERVQDFFLRENPEQLEWTVIALNNWDLLDNAAPDREQCVNNTDVRKVWVEGQYSYYKKTSDRLMSQAVKIHRRAVTVALVSMVLGIYFFIDTFLCRLTPQWLAGPLYDMNGILVGFGSFFMASLNFLLEKKGWKETAESYASQAKLFSVISGCLELMPQKKDIYLSYLGRAAILEHEEWLNLQRKRKPNPNI